MEPLAGVAKLKGRSQIQPGSPGCGLVSNQIGCGKGEYKMAKSEVRVPAGTLVRFPYGKHTLVGYVTGRDAFGGYRICTKPGAYFTSDVVEVV